ncbi:hypothetical protein FRX31_034094 [Thalictrum thalictroides]|uniref:Uncharacterized protein n=1 Tax=Thalictrum thalictroides TaxID=46969 RepID=A0A7J6UVT2_THATH|nr:hypothetical protein FRX31_034094 [Thalictrum thalictroides]
MGQEIEQQPVAKQAKALTPAVIKAVLLDDRELHRYDNNVSIGWLRLKQGLVAHYVTTSILGTTRTSQLFSDDIHILRLLQEETNGYCIVRHLHSFHFCTFSEPSDEYSLPPSSSPSSAVVLSVCLSTGGPQL